MATITVKNIPDEVYELLKEAAQAHRRSINSEIIVRLERSLGSEPVKSGAALAAARQIRELTADYAITDEAFNRAKRTGRP